ncbi:hypothetical protein MFFC18_36210 [Mariniblastus fucicola]|uniref:Uncharacterized protein n=1 Tax=Mariniblastus fucicola TaxID=980251 RepID=A0A5B9PEX0_9BACT|nr:hypothetical protein MFFC18_36210 [Mariniblastus fucicola]
MAETGAKSKSKSEFESSRDSAELRFLKHLKFAAAPNNLLAEEGIVFIRRALQRLRSHSENLPFSPQFALFSPADHQLGRQEVPSNKSP